MTNYGLKNGDLGYGGSGLMNFKLNLPTSACRHNKSKLRSVVYETPEFIIEFRQNIKAVRLVQGFRILDPPCTR